MLMAPSLFVLSSTWHVPATPEQVWAIIADIDMSRLNSSPRCSLHFQIQFPLSGSAVARLTSCRD